MSQPFKPRGKALPVDQIAQINSKGEVVITLNDMQRAIAGADPALKRFLQARGE